MDNKRPKLDRNISPKDFKDFYWLKKELVLFCKEYNVISSGGKIEIANRIIHFLETGERIKSVKDKIDKPKSNFDWNTERLHLKTIITDNYKNTENVRKFFTSMVGKHFKFNVLFMNWMKQNVGKTLNDAITEWNQINLIKNGKNYEPEIGSQFEYNRYMRDFLKNNPDMTPNDARKYWMLKRETRGSKKYTKEDLLLK
ncbi:cytoplasmic protein [bacterium]|nr:cytoplasmic protein [bacterium]